MFWEKQINYRRKEQTVVMLLHIMSAYQLAEKEAKFILQISSQIFLA